MGISSLIKCNKVWATILILHRLNRDDNVNNECDQNPSEMHNNLFLSLLFYCIILWKMLFILNKVHQTFKCRHVAVILQYINQQLQAMNKLLYIIERSRNVKVESLGDRFSGLTE
jgi:hypothetical protein